LGGVVPLAAKPDALVSVGDVSVTELGGAFVRRRLDRGGLERVAEPMVTGRLDPNITATYPLARAGVHWHSSSPATRRASSSST
jgi:hypothetical protein